MPLAIVDTSSLTSTDVKADPVLKSIAQKQEPTRMLPKSAGTGPGFVARPAPARRESVGPRMTKAAALRQGLNWEDVKHKREVKKGGKEEEEKGMPGYKRTGLNINVASLGTPSIVPRQTRASQLRAGQVGTTPQRAERRNPEAIVAANKARLEEEKERRRKSIVMPASLGAPSIAPRQTRSSMLRTGVMSPESVSSGSSVTRAMSCLSVGERTPVASRARSSVDLPRETEAEAKARRRASVQGVKSLGAPSITPRLNRSAMLRAPHTSHASISHPPSSFTSPSPSDYTPPRQPHTRPTSSASVTQQSTGGVRRTAPSPGPGPKATKSSLSRAAHKALSVQQ
ncbi:hypothetical protein IAR50_005535 [Cryptococcus sp. DSM 104548]